MYFPPKKDLWLGLVIWLSLLLPLVFIIHDIIIHDHDAWPSLVVLVPAILFFGWIWFGTGYTITEKELLVKCGPFRERIPFGKIRSVRRSRVPWSSAALSLDRLEIRHAYSLTQVSPADADLFVSELKRRCPQADFGGLLPEGPPRRPAEPLQQKEGERGDKRG